MAKTKENVKKAEEFVRRVLSKNFNQKTIDADRLRLAAEKLCEAIPDKKRAA
jgi:hypothetical protein